jgi:hypothetical protein
MNIIGLTNINPFLHLLCSSPTECLFTLPWRLGVRSSDPHENVLNPLMECFLPLRLTEKWVALLPRIMSCESEARRHKQIPFKVTIRYTQIAILSNVGRIAEKTRETKRQKA